MNRRRKILVGVGTAAAVTLAGAATVAASGVADDEGTEVPITGPALQRASAAALDITGGGRVTATEVGDEEGYYEVEVTLEDGSQIDVHLDEEFRHLGSQDDGVDDRADSD